MADNYKYNSNMNSVLNTQRAYGDKTGVVGTIGGNQAVTSTNVNVYANGMKVGFIQSFNPSESRNIIKVQELGTEGVVQSVPSNTNGGQLSVSRFAVYNSSLFNALGATPSGLYTPTSSDGFKAGDTNVYDGTTNSYGNPFRTLKDQRVPLEVAVETTMPDGTPYVETYIDCWLASYSKTIAATTITITETATIQYSDVI